MFTVHTYLEHSVPAPYHNNGDNQDAVAIAQNNKILAVALCDGAGSKTKSKQGANFVAHMATDFANNLTNSKHEHYSPNLDVDTPEGLTKLSILAVKEARWQLMSMYPNEHTDMSCTLTLVLLNLNNGLLCTTNVGDSFVVLGQKTNTSIAYQLFYNHRETEFANQTTFINSFPNLSDDKLDESKLWQTSYTYLDTTFAGIFVSSDGLLSQAVVGPHGDSPSLREEFIEPLFSRLENDKLDLENFLEWLKHKEVLLDDTTMVAIGVKSSTIQKTLTELLEEDEHEGNC